MQFFIRFYFDAGHVFVPPNLNPTYFHPFLRETAISVACSADDPDFFLDFEENFVID
jgi:hypothetical protein